MYLETEKQLKTGGFRSIPMRFEAKKSKNPKSIVSRKWKNAINGGPKIRKLKKNSKTSKKQQNWESVPKIQKNNENHGKKIGKKTKKQGKNNVT